MNVVKKLLYMALTGLFLSFCAIPQAQAAVRLTPQHLYIWAKQKNLFRLSQFQKYIDIQDKNHNTALCIAQQHKDRDTYALLLKLGASKKVSCHDDNDPICAVISGEKIKVSPAGWLLLGAGAVAGAYTLLDNDGGHKHKRCPVGYEKGLTDCSGKTHPQGWDYTESDAAGGIHCGWYE